MIGGKIKLIRKSYNITLKELSNRTGLSVSFLSNIERNTASPTLEHLQLQHALAERDRDEHRRAIRTRRSRRPF